MRQIAFLDVFINTHQLPYSEQVKQLVNDIWSTIPNDWKKIFKRINYSNGVESPNYQITDFLPPSVNTQRVAGSSSAEALRPREQKLQEQKDLADAYAKINAANFLYVFYHPIKRQTDVSISMDFNLTNFPIYQELAEKYKDTEIDWEKQWKEEGVAKLQSAIPGLFKSVAITLTEKTDENRQEIVVTFSHNFS